MTDLHITLQEINTVINQQDLDTKALPQSLTSITSALSRTRGTLSILDSLINERLIGTSGAVNRPKIRRLVWLREKNKVIAINDELRTRRLELLAGIGAQLL
jgi:hypothetical protein